MPKEPEIDEFLEKGLKQMHSAEKQTIDALEILAKRAKLPELKQLFTQHQEESKKQLERVEQALQILKRSEPKGALEKGREVVEEASGLKFAMKNSAMDEIIDEGKEYIKHWGDTQLGDLALITAAQKVECYEITSYKNLMWIAEQSGHKDIAALLLASLNEEKHAIDVLNTALTHLRLPVKARV